MSLFAKSSLSSWATALPAAVLVHAAAFGLALVLGGSPSYGAIDGEHTFTISIDGESAAAIETEPLRVDAAETVEYDPRAAVENFLPQHAALEHKAETSAQRSTLTPRSQRGDEREPVRLATGGSSGPGERGQSGTLAFGDAGDEPLAAAPLPALDSGGARGSGNTNHKDDLGFGDGVTGTRSGSANARGGKDLFSQVADQMAAQHTRQRFALKGQPGFPSACRSGHARNGVPCEGSSEWRVTVGPEGGRPEKVEATRPMDCELQNASIRKFLGEYKFPQSGRTDIYIFPVEMRVAR